jgi:hypothetical protein
MDETSLRTANDPVATYYDDPATAQGCPSDQLSGDDTTKFILTTGLKTGVAIKSRFSTVGRRTLPVSNHRLLSVSDSEVDFRWKDYVHGSKPRTMTLSPEEFLHRFLQHVLPRGFPRIRYFGWLANRVRKNLLPLCRLLLNQQPPATDLSSSYQHATWQCPLCHGPMYVIERLTAAQILLLECRLVCAYDTS